MSYEPEKDAKEPPPLSTHASTNQYKHTTLSELSGGGHVSRRGSPEVSKPSSPRHFPTTYNPQCRVDLNGIYPETWHAYVPRILDRYLLNMAIDVPDIDGIEATGLLRMDFFPFILTDRASMHAVMLIAASHYGKVRGKKWDTIDFLQLKGMAIREINSALAEDGRGTSDQLIAAVSTMASYEALFGDHTTCNTHMQGLTRMVRLRGEVYRLGLDGLLQRLVLWADKHTSHITGDRLCFDESA